MRQSVRLLLLVVCMCGWAVEARGFGFFQVEGLGAFDGQGVPIVSGAVVEWDSRHLEWSKASTYVLEFTGGILTGEVDVPGEPVYREYSGSSFRIVRDDGQVELSGLVPFYSMTSNLDRGVWFLDDGEIIFDGGESELPSGGNVVYFLNIEFVRRLDVGYDATVCTGYAIYESVDSESWSESKARWRSPN